MNQASQSTLFLSYNDWFRNGQVKKKIKSIRESLILASTVKEDVPHSGSKQKLIMAFGAIWS